MTQTKKQGRLRRRLYALTAALALVVSLFSGIPARKVVEAAEVWEDTELIVNGDFSVDLSDDGHGWSPWRDDAFTDATWTNNGKFHYYNGGDGDAWKKFSLYQEVTIEEAGSYKISFAANEKCYYDFKIDNTSKAGVSVDTSDAMVNYTTDSFDLDAGQHGITVEASVPSKGYGDLDDIKLLWLKSYTAKVSGSPYQKKVSTTPVTITVNTTTDNIDKISVGTAELAATNYSVTKSTDEKSSIITLATSYLDTLEANKYTATISFKDGVDGATCEFSVTEKPDHSIVVNVDKFNSNDAGADPITMTVDCTSDKIASVSVGSTALTKDTDYTLAASTDEKSTIITFATTYLTSLDLGKYTATVAFSDNADSKEGTFTVSELPVGLQNGDFESTGADYIWNGGFGTQSKQNNNSGTYLNLWTDNKTSETILSQTFIAEKTGTFDISYKVIGDGDSGIDIYVNGTSIGSIVGDSNSWPEVTTTKPFKLTQGEVVKIEIKGIYSGTWAAIDDITIVEHSDEAEIPVGLQNGDFEASKYWEKNNRTEEGKTAEPFKIIKDDKGGTNETTYLNIWTEDTTKEYSISQTFKAEESGQYVINYKYLGSEGACGFDIYVNDTKVETLSGKGWTGDGVWTEKTTKTVFELKKDAVVTFAIKGKAASSSAYMKLDDIKIVPYEVDENARVFDIDTTIATGDKVDTDLYVEKLDLAKGFITGADISSYASIVASGATYKDAKGEPLSDAEFFKLLAESGVNYVRIRVWVDPTDGNGNGYGGGNCDLATAKKLGKLATDAGMKVLIDFHYSDFWTDPGKQTAPKTWQGLALEEKAEKLYKWTYDSLIDIINNGEVNVGMVQIGNETTTGFCGETKRENMCFLFKSGSDAVRAVEEELYEGKPTIMMAIHLTNPNSVDFSGYAKDLKENGVVYDVFATSFYPYWHGTLDNLYKQLAEVADEYDKYVMVAETSYVRTLEDGDGWENTESQKKYDGGTDVFPYDISEQGQVLHIRNVIDTLTSIPDNKGIGVFWWEPAWIPVQNWAAADDQDKVLAENKALWEKCGSGWATSAAADYDKDVGQWYGGSAVDNESWFDFDGKALESLKVYNMVRYGTNSEDYLIDVLDTKYSFAEGEQYSFPTKVNALYASGKTNEVEVKWDQNQIKKAVATGRGSYEIEGTVTYNGNKYEVICNLTIKPKNYLVNGSFEDGEKGWKIERTNEGDSVKDKSDKKAGSPSSHDGTKSFHFWSDTAQSFEVSQNVTLEPGVYTFTGYFQGFSGVYGSLFYKTGNKTHTIGYVLNGWENWQNPSIDRIIITEKTDVTVGFTCKYNAGDWGTCDDFYLFKEADVFTVTFDNNGHGKAPEAAFVVEGETVDEPKDLETEGYTFIGWYTDKTCTQSFSFSKYITSDITLYAGWTKNPAKSYYQDGNSNGNIGGSSWTPGDGDLHSMYHSTVNDAETIIHFKGVDIARYLNDTDMAAENGFEAAADAVARGLAPSSAGFTPFAAIGGSSLRAESGSLKLTILSSYLETLDPGYYLLRIVFDDGEVYTMLTINAKAADAEVEPDDNKAADDEVEPDDNKAADADVEPADDSTSKDTAPKTADETPIEAAMLILLISAAGLSYILGLKRKRS